MKEKDYCALLLYCMTGLFVTEYYEFIIPIPLVLLMGIVSVLCIHLLIKYRKSTFVHIGLIVLLLLVSIFILLRYRELIQATKLYYQWLCDEAHVTKQVRFAYTFLTIWIVYLLCFPWFLITRKKLCRLLTSIILMCGFIGLYICEYKVDKLTTSFFLIYLFLCLIEFSITKHSKGTKTLAQDTLTNLMPFALIMLFLLCLIPTSNHPIRIKPLHTIGNKLVSCKNYVVKQYNQMIYPHDDGDFNLAFAGYSENGEIGQGVQDNDKLALRVEDHSTYIANSFYLIGNIQNEFNGKRWTNTVKKDKTLSKYSDYELQLYEVMNALHTIPSVSEHKKELIEITNLYIQYIDTSTKAAFHPANVMSFTSFKKKLALTTKGDNIRRKKKPKFGTKYWVNALELRSDTPLLNFALEKATDTDYTWTFTDSALLKKEIEALSGQDITEIDDLESILRHRADFIQDNYTEIPKFVSEDVRQLAKDITASGKTTYEKLKLIETYLNNFTYTKQPTTAKKGDNFLDYFLFESQEGYCTYTATAMTILSRCIGVPSRFVQGYYAKKNLNKKIFDVLGNDAHAWCEVYIKGFGWVTFEPTAGYHNPHNPYKLNNQLKITKKNNTLHDNDNQSDNDTSDDKDNDSTNKDKDDKDDIKQTAPISTDDSANLEDISSDKMSSPDQSGNGNNAKDKKQTLFLNIIPLFLIIVAVILCIYLRFIIIKYRKKKKGKIAIPKEKKLYHTLQCMIYLFAKLQLCVEENPTLWEQFESVYAHGEFHDELTLTVAYIYMELCYSDKTLDEAKIQAINKFYKKLLLYAKTMYNPVQYNLLVIYLKNIKTKKHKGIS